jgi:hypothetical protein
MSIRYTNDVLKSKNQSEIVGIYQQYYYLHFDNHESVINCFQQEASIIFECL